MVPSDAIHSQPQPPEVVAGLHYAARLVASQLVSLADKDGSGSISREELREAIVSLTSGNKRGKEQADALERAFDAWLTSSFLPRALASLKLNKHLQVGRRESSSG